MVGRSFINYKISWVVLQGGLMVGATKRQGLTYYQHKAGKCVRVFELRV
jgi:hypothetical protein